MTRVVPSWIGPKETEFVLYWWITAIKLTCKVPRKQSLKLQTMGQLQTQEYELFGKLNLFFLQEKHASQTRNSTYKPFENSTRVVPSWIGPKETEFVLYWWITAIKLTCKVPRKQSLKLQNMGQLQTQEYELFGKLNLFFLQEKHASQTRNSTYKPFENSYHHGNVDRNKRLLPVLLVTSQKAGKKFFILSVGSHDKLSFTGLSRFSKFSPLAAIPPTGQLLSTLYAHQTAL